MFRELTTLVFSTMAVFGVACLLVFSPAQAQPLELDNTASVAKFAAPYLVAAAKKKRYNYSPRRSGSGQLSGNGGGGVKLIPKGECCQKVLNACATICNRSGGCTGNGDCSVNPN